MAEADPRKQLIEVVKKFDGGMLVTRAGSGFHARPMAISEIEGDGDMYFASGVDSAKVKEIEADPNVTITLQSGGRYASVNGMATIQRDKALIDRLWREAWKVWFPGGKSDPNLCIISLDATSGEYWDNAGAKGVSYIVKAATAYTTGTTPKVDRSEHAKTSL